MRRHWQHTSFCMGQCVSSCGSKRTLDSVPTTPDTENYPGLIPQSRCVKRNSINYPSNEQVLALALLNKSPSRSPAAKFVTAFSQKKITCRIQPGIESPLRLESNSPPSTLPLKITTLLTPVGKDGDMKGTPVKSYFRETISSAKKSSKTVTFSEATPPSTSSTTRKKPFFSFGKSSETPNDRETSQSPPSKNLKGFFRKKGPTQLPVVTKRPVTPKEKQICRVTLSPKQGSSKATSGVCSKPSFEQHKLTRNANGGTPGNEFSESNEQVPATESQTMGNAHSSRANVNEVTKKITSIVKSASFVKDKENRAGDINENIKPHHHHHNRNLITSQSAESQVLNCKDESKSESGVLRNLNSIREENRLLRLKFFSEDSSPETPTQQLPGCVTEAIEKPTMNRQNFIGNKTGIPQPKSFGVKPPNNNSSGLPKLYSVPIGDKHDSSKKTGPMPAPLNSRLKFGSKADINQQQQPTNLNNGKWVPATDFFEPPTESSRPQTSPAATRNARRSSEPPRWAQGPLGNKLVKKQEPLSNDHIVERRGTIAFQPRRLPVSQPGGIPKFAKPVAVPSSEKSGTGLKAPTTTSTSSRIGIRKPEETKPFYTIGLYQNQRKPQQAQGAKSFGILQSGFHGVSTGIVRQRTEQFQSKVSEVSKSSPNTSIELHEANKKDGNKSASPSPGKPGVIRSATYTIRKHPSSTVEQVSTSVEKGASGNNLALDSKNNVDPRYLTWTVKKGFGPRTNLNTSLINTSEQLEDSISPESSMISSTQSRFTDSVGYPLQHDASGTSTSSMGTNEDGVGDHVMISDSEYLIDDEISDQPELTLTFKDSSLILSPSSSGESLLSCDIMLDHLDHNKERILGELTSDSAISDISSHKPASQCSSDQISKLSDVKQPIIDEHSKVMGLRSSPSDGSPASVRTVRHPKSPRRCIKTPQGYNTSRTSRQLSGDATSIPRLTSSDYKSPISSSVKSHTTPEKRLASAKPSHVRTILSGSTSLSPANSNRSAKKDSSVAGLTIENVSKLGKQFELQSSDSEYNAVEDQNRLPVPLVDEILLEFQELKDKLGELQIQLDTQERRERDKDELIHRLTVEMKRLKSIVGEETVNKPHQRNGSVIPILSENSSDISTHKECYINSLNFENAAVQTENNNIFNRAVTYPDEDDKYGELVSFRIGRSSSVKKKL